MILFLLVATILSSGEPYEIFRRSTSTFSLSLSRKGKNLVLCREDYCKYYKMNGYEYDWVNSWIISYSGEKNFHNCCKPKFSQSQNYVYYFGLDSLMRRQLETAQMNSIQEIENFKFFGKNQQYIVVLTNSTNLAIYNQHLDLPFLVRNVNPFYSDVHYVSVNKLVGLDISSDGNIVGLMLNNVSDKYYFYYASSRKKIVNISLQAAKINLRGKAYVWMTPSSILCVQQTGYMRKFFKYLFIDRNSSYHNAEIQEQFQSFEAPPSFMIMTEDKQYICLVKDVQSPLFPLITTISLYPSSNFESELSQQNRTGLPELTIYEVGVIKSIQITANGSQIAYIREDQSGQKEFVVVFHTLGVEESIYPCYTTQYRQRYSFLCEDMPIQLQIIGYILLFTIFIFLIVVIVCFFMKLKQMKQQIEKEKQQKQKERKEMELKEQEQDAKEISRVFQKMPREHFQETQEAIEIVEDKKNQEDMKL